MLQLGVRAAGAPAAVLVVLEDEIDEAWNPRNKTLSDVKLYADIAKHGCEQASWIARRLICGNTTTLATRFHFGVTQVLADRDWPITHQDYAHVGGYREQIDPDFPNYAFVNCAPATPTIANIDIRQSVGSGYTVTWDNVEGCVEGIEIASMNLCIKLQYETPVYYLKCQNNLSPTATSTSFSLVGNWDQAKARSAIVVGERIAAEHQITSGGASYKLVHYDVPVRHQ